MIKQNGYTYDMKDKKHITNTLQERLTLLMEMRGINKSALARMADVRPQAVTKWFDRGEIGKESAMKIAEQAHVSVDWILHGGAELHELSEHRKKRLEKWQSEHDAKEDFSKFLSGEVFITDKTARRIETDNAMPLGYLDAELSIPQQIIMSVEDKELLYHFHKLPQEARDEILALTRDKAEFYDRMFDELAKLRALKTP